MLLSYNNSVLVLICFFILCMNVKAQDLVVLGRFKYLRDVKQRIVYLDDIYESKPPNKLIYQHFFQYYNDINSNDLLRQLVAANILLKATKSKNHIKEYILMNNTEFEDPAVWYHSFNKELFFQEEGKTNITQPEKNNK